MRRTFTLILISSLFALAPCAAPRSRAGVALTDSKPSCERWRAMVDPQARSSTNRPDVEHLSEAESLAGIACLLSLEGDRRLGKFSGATRMDVSQFFPRATIELDALYVISAIYNEKWDHASGVALVDRKSRILSPRAAAKLAFPAVKAWYLRVQGGSLQELRIAQDDPLKTSGVKWY